MTSESTDCELTPKQSVTPTNGTPTRKKNNHLKTYETCTNSSSIITSSPHSYKSIDHSPSSLIYYSNRRQKSNIVFSSESEYDDSTSFESTPIHIPKSNRNPNKFKALTIVSSGSSQESNVIHSNLILSSESDGDFSTSNNRIPLHLPKRYGNECFGDSSGSREGVNVNTSNRSFSSEAEDDLSNSDEKTPQHFPKRNRSKSKPFSIMVSSNSCDDGKVATSRIIPSLESEKDFSSSDENSPIHLPKSNRNRNKFKALTIVTSSGSSDDGDDSELEEIKAPLDLVTRHFQDLSVSTQPEYGSPKQVVRSTELSSVSSTESDYDEFNRPGIIIFSGENAKPTEFKEVNRISPPHPNQLQKKNLRTPKDTNKPSQFQFKKSRQDISQDLFKEFNMNIFDNQLPSNLQIQWTHKIRKTAGRAFMTKRKLGNGEISYESRIELSFKVVDTMDRLRNTLVHELCHCAAWLINHTNSPPHGEAFYYWGNKAMEVYSDITVSRCHSYEIEYKYRYLCTNSNCGKIYGRHSKSIDTSRLGCGYCKSRLELQERLKKDGTPFKKREPNSFQLFMKEHFKRIQLEHPGIPHRDIMKLVSEEYKTQITAFEKMAER